ncbi:MAG: polysaccharide biosynthesis tyrosine autokinase, partial [Flammeovirgaceae bacterium]
IKNRSVIDYKAVPFVMVINDPTSIAASYVGNLGVKWAELGSSVVELSISGTNPQRETDFLNQLIKKYQYHDLIKKNQSASRTVSFIEEQLVGITDSLRGFEGKIEDFKSRNHSSNVNVGLEAQRVFTKLEALELQKTELLVKNNYYEYIEKYMKKGENLDQVILPSSLGISDAVVTGLVTRMVDTQLELKIFLGRDKISNPLVSQKMERINEIKQDVLESINTLRSTDKIKLDFINAQIKKAEQQVEYLPVAERKLVSIQRNYSLLENLYVFLMQKMSEAGISRASNTSDVIVVNPPMSSDVPSHERRNYIIFFGIGLSIPSLIFVLMELLNVKIQSKEDIEKITSLPFMGGVGHSINENNLAVFDSPKSGIAESFRALRSNLNFFTGNQTKKVFLVSSSISGEGKTFTTINLATVFAMSKKKTLIIGADMRRPKIFSDFNLNNSIGLSNYLSNLNSFHEVIQSSKIDNLYLISGGPVPPNPAELLLSERFDELVKEALVEFDFVIIDTPPMALVTDAFVMSRVSDLVIFVVRQNYTDKSFVKNIHEYNTSGRIKNVSIVLNDIFKSGLGYGYGYSYGYGYGLGNKKSSKNGHGYYVK